MINFVVIDENKLCCIHDEQPNFANILSSSILKGATQHYGTIHMPTEIRIRTATKKDFEDFRLSTTGFQNDPHYNFPQN